jgi:hypothetical protein
MNEAMVAKSWRGPAMPSIDENRVGWATRGNWTFSAALRQIFS